MPSKEIVQTSNDLTRRKSKSPSKPTDLLEGMVTDRKDTPTSNVCTKGE